jgi:uncharacterized protein (TIGR03905 family)
LQRFGEKQLTKAIGLMEKIVILPEGVCCDRILVELDDGDIIRGVHFEGGCPGNSIALGRLLAGQPAEKTALILAGVDCDGKGTSCADQLSRGLKKHLA